MTRIVRTAVAVAIAAAGLSMLAGSSFGDPANVKAPTTKDITKPDSKSEYMVLVNGKYHKITVKQKVTEITGADGLTQVRVVDDPIDTKVQLSKLPRRDPAFDDVVPNEADLVGARAELGMEPDGSPRRPPGK